MCNISENFMIHENNVRINLFIFDIIKICMDSRLRLLKVKTGDVAYFIFHSRVQMYYKVLQACMSI